MAEECNGRTEWEEYYKLPIVPNHEYAYYPTSNDIHALTFCGRVLAKPNFIKWVIDKINGSEIAPECEEYNDVFTFSSKGDAIVAKEGSEKYVIANVRGWGTLTSKAGYNLPKCVAADVQDAFVGHLIYQLNKQITGMFTIKEVVKELNEGKVVYDTKDRVFIYKQVPTIVPREIVPKMTSLPNEMKDIVKMYSGKMDFAPVQYNKYNPENGLTETWCPGCAWFGNGRYVLASDFLNKQ